MTLQSDNMGYLFVSKPAFVRSFNVCITVFLHVDITIFTQANTSSHAKKSLSEVTGLAYLFTFLLIV